MKRAKRGTLKAWAIEWTLSLITRQLMSDPDCKNYDRETRKAIRELMDDLRSKLPQ